MFDLDQSTTAMGVVTFGATDKKISGGAI